MFREKDFTLEVHNVLKYFIFILLMGNINPTVMPWFECVPKTSDIGSFNLLGGDAEKQEDI